MKYKIYSLLLLLPFWFFSLTASAQDGTTLNKGGADKVEMADLLRANGKIYIVVTILVTIFIGLVLYIARLDRKISRFEKESSRV
ncbi:CcmD family protein [Flavitalea flava]